MVMSVHMCAGGALVDEIFGVALIKMAEITNVGVRRIAGIRRNQT